LPGAKAALHPNSNRKDKTMATNYKPYVLEFDLKPDTGLDVVGDIHGCMDELLDLMRAAGYLVSQLPSTREFHISHPEGRTLILVGDIVDRGPRNLDALRFLRSLMISGVGTAVIGNHDYKALRAMHGRNVVVANGLDLTLAELQMADPSEVADLRDALGAMPTQILIRRPGSQEILIVHGSAPERHQLLQKKNSFERSIYGYAGEAHNGILERLDWAQDYSGSRMVIHGHEPTPQRRFVNNVHNIDTGCVYGGIMTMFRVYEGQFLEQPARQVYHPRIDFASN